MPGSQKTHYDKRSKHRPAETTKPRAREKTARKSAVVFPSIAVLVAIASVAGLLLAAFGIGLSLASVASGSNRSSATIAAASDPIKSDPHSKGNPNAPITVVEWSDFQCPACRAYEERIDPDFQKQYVDTGKVKYVSKYFAFLGPESYAAAEAAEAAAAQGKFWAYSALLWQNQGAENSGAFTPERLKQLASQAGLDRKAFDGALDSGKYKQFVLDQKQEGISLGVNATPSFFVNGKKLPGVPNAQGWAQIIDLESASK